MFLSVVDADDLSRKDEVLLDSVLHWFNQDQSRVKTFSDIVNHRNGLSLRIIDWLITNFSKAFSVAIESDGLPRNLCKDYHKNLNAHNKKNFDPFARRRRIQIVLFGREQRVSTIGQLNFFRWFLSKDLVGFLLQNKTVIEKHMKEAEPSAVARKAVQIAQQRRPEKKARADFFEQQCAAEPQAVVKRHKTCVAAEPQLYSGTFRMSF